MSCYIMSSRRRVVAVIVVAAFDYSQLFLGHAFYASQTDRKTCAAFQIRQNPAIFLTRATQSLHSGRHSGQQHGPGHLISSSHPSTTKTG